MKGKKLLIGIVAAVVILGMIRFIYAMNTENVLHADAAIGTHEVDVLGKHDLSTSIIATGTVESRNVVAVTTDLTAKCKEVNVALGDYVKAGDVLCTFDDSDLKEQIASLEEQVSTSQQLEAKQIEIAQRSLNEAVSSKEQSLAEASAAITTAQDTYNSVKAVYDSMKKGAEKKAYYAETVLPASQAVDAANAAYNSAVTQADAAIQSARDSYDTTVLNSGGESSTTKSLSDLYRQLENVTVTAEQSGIITSINIRQGGVATGTLMTIEDSDHLQVRVSIKETDILKLSTGMKVTMKSDAIGDEQPTGKVTKVINFASTSTGLDGNTSSSGYSAVIDVDAGSRLLLGMTVKAEISLTETGEKLSVPYDSIVKDDSGTYVFRVINAGDGTNVAERVDVTCGIEGAYYTEISSDALSEGDFILMNPEGIADGDTVTIVVLDSDAAEAAGNSANAAGASAETANKTTADAEVSTAE